MKTSHLFAAAAAAAAWAPGAAVAQNQGLLYTPLTAETGNQCAAAAAPLTTTVGSRRIQHIEPAIGALSAAWMTHRGLEVLLGDSDGDNQHLEAALFGRIDALLPPFRVVGGALVPIPPSGRNVWFSVAATTPTLAGAGTLQADGLGRLLGWPLADSFAEPFITRALIDQAFGTAGQQLDVDAAAICPQALFLSFETQVMIGGVAVPDGSIVAIPFPAIAWGVSPYPDGAAVVANVVMGSGVIIALEGQVDGWVQASGIRDNAGNVPGGGMFALVGDLDGLETEPQGGTFYSQWVENHPAFPAGQVCNLIFSGLNLTGGGIVSSAWNGMAYGSIAVINGVQMGNDAAGPVTTGLRVGLVTVGGVGSLNGLGLTPGGLVRCATESTPSIPAAGGVLSIELASDPGATGLLLASYPAAYGAFTVDPSLGLGLLPFPDLCTIPPIVVAMGASGCQVWNFGIMMPPCFTRILFQGARIDPATGTVALGPPSHTQFCY